MLMVYLCCCGCDGVMCCGVPVLWWVWWWQQNWYLRAAWSLDCWEVKTVFAMPPSQLLCSAHVYTVLRHIVYNNINIYIYDLVPKGVHHGGGGGGGGEGWLPIKSVSNTLSCCCFVCVDNWSVAKWKQYGAAGAILIFESEKRHQIWPLKMDMLTVSAFDAFIHIHVKSKHYLSHWFVHRRYRFTRCI